MIVCTPADSALVLQATRELELTSFGHRVLAGEADFLESNPRECWIGGVCLSPDNDWRWNAQTREAVRA